MELVKHEQPDQSAAVVTLYEQQKEFAKIASTSALVPTAYRGKPADILIAVMLGQSMGLSMSESLLRIDVIGGKPTASAELIASNVRKAGHKLRVTTSDTSATATIVRKDDPSYEHTVTRDLEWAKGMGLTGKDNYRKQPGTMLQWRAITAVARLACPEALYGIAYTPDELEDMRPEQSAPKASAADFVSEPVEAVEINDEDEQP